MPAEFKTCDIPTRGYILIFSGYMARSGIAGSYGSSIFSFFEEPPYCSPWWLYQITFPAMVLEGSLFSRPAPALIVCRFFDDGCADWPEVTAHCSFNLHFCNTVWSIVVSCASWPGG